MRPRSLLARVHQTQTWEYKTEKGRRRNDDAFCLVFLDKMLSARHLKSS